MEVTAPESRVPQTASPAFLRRSQKTDSARPVAPVRKKPHHVRRAGLFFFAIIVLAMIVGNDSVHAWIDAFVRRSASVIDTHPIAGLFIFSSLSALSAMLRPRFTGGALPDFWQALATTSTAATTTSSRFMRRAPA